MILTNLPIDDPKITLPAEWAEQSGVMVTWPHEGTDWSGMLGEVEGCFVEIAQAIAEREKLLAVCADSRILREKLSKCRTENIVYAELPSNDTWARDHGAITVIINGVPTLYDFTFNGWGLKFSANFDNQIKRSLYDGGFFKKGAQYKNMQHLVLEGGSVESDGVGTLLTTRQCLLSANRNSHLTDEMIEKQLIGLFGLQRVLWLTSGYLAGDDTDGHIDTLARFCGPGTIAYVKCDDPDDEHYRALSLMESEIAQFRTLRGEPYQLVPLPMAEAVYDGGHRLPATYANFLVINGAVLVPTYSSAKDRTAIGQLAKAFPGREVIGIDCRPLIKQHGSLHCVAMQFPKGAL